MSSTLKKITIRDIQNKPYSKCVLPYFYKGEYVMAEINSTDNIRSVAILTKPFKDLKTLLTSYDLIKSPKPFLPYYILHEDATSAL